MLTWMRQRRNSKIVFLVFLFIAVSFVVGFGISGTMNRNEQSGGMGPRVALVYDEVVTRNRLENVMRNLSQKSGRESALNEASAKALQKEATDSLIEQAALIHEAKALDLQVTDSVLRDYIQKMPSFFDAASGKFDPRMYDELYTGPTQKASFEADQRRALISSAVADLLNSSAQATPAEIRSEYDKEGAQMKLGILTVNSATFEHPVTVDDAALKAHYDAHLDDYRKPEARKVEFLSANLKALAGGAEATDAEIQTYYDGHKDKFAQPEEVRASHILFKVPEDAAPEKDAEVKAKAEKILKQVEAGGNFAELAKANSEDGSASQGGDLDFFAKGRMVPEFNDAAFSMKTGDVKGLVKTKFGYHIIKVTDRRGGGAKPLADAKEEIRKTLESEKLAESSKRAAARLEELLSSEAGKPADLKAVAEKDPALKYGQTDFFEHDAAELPGVSTALIFSFREKAFATDQGLLSGHFGNNETQYVLRPTEIRKSSQLTLDEVKEKVKEAVTVAKKEEELKKIAEGWLGEWKSGKDIPAEMKNAKGVSYEETEAFKIGNFVAPVLGYDEVFNKAKYDLTEEQPFLKEPLADGAQIHLVKLVERTAADPAGFSEAEPMLRMKLQRQKASLLITQFSKAAVQEAEKSGAVQRYNE